MKIFVITLSLMSGLVGSTHVTGYSGGGVIVVIREWRDSFRLRRICKSAESDCSSRVYSYTQNDTVHDRKISLYKKTETSFTVFIRELNLQDAGTWIFGDKNNWRQEMNLKVLNDSCCVKSVTVTGYLERNVTISCDYAQEHQLKRKYFYKVEGHSADAVIYTYSRSAYWKNGFHISDNQYSNTFTISIRNLKDVDAGIYFCAIGIFEYPNTFSSTIKTVHLRVTGKTSSIQITGLFGGRIMVKCKHSKEKPKGRFFCKESQGECPERTDAKVQNEWQHHGKFSLYNDISGESLKVFLRNLSEGTYRCGVEVSEFRERYIEVKMEVTRDPCCGRTISQAESVNKTVKVTCQYPPMYGTSPKHFCKEDENLICRDIKPQIAAGKFSLSEYNQAGSFIVTLNNLTLGDAGVYWCGTETSEGDISYTSLTTKVQISVIASKLIGYEGDGVEIRCPYESKYKQNSKHFCKEEEECSTERKNLQIKQALTPTKVENFSLHDNVLAAVFSVNISRLRAEDAGKYWCGVRTGDVVMNFLSTELQIVRKKELQVIGREELSVSIECSYRRPAVKNNGTFFCRGEHLSGCSKDRAKLSSEKKRNGRFSLREDEPAAVFTVTITDLKEEDSGTYWCGEETFGSTIYTKVHLQVTEGSSIIITVCVCVTLLLIGGSALIFYTLRSSRRQGSKDTIPSERTEVADTDEASPAVYEEINLTDINMKASTTNSADDTDLCVYSTVRLPTDEGPTYATVSFQKNSDGSTVTFTKEESATEYATVKHLRLE